MLARAGGPKRLIKCECESGSITRVSGEHEVWVVEPKSFNPMSLHSEVKLKLNRYMLDQVIKGPTVEREILDRRPGITGDQGWSLYIFGSVYSLQEYHKAGTISGGCQRVGIIDPHFQKPGTRLLPSVLWSRKTLPVPQNVAITPTAPLVKPLIPAGSPRNVGAVVYYHRRLETGQIDSILIHNDITPMKPPTFSELQHDANGDLMFTHRSQLVEFLLN